MKAEGVKKYIPAGCDAESFDFQLGVYKRYKKNGKIAHITEYDSILGDSTMVTDIFFWFGKPFSLIRYYIIDVVDRKLNCTDEFRLGNHKIEKQYRIDYEKENVPLQEGYESLNGRQGPWKFYDNGKLLKIVNYKDGKKVSGT
jgi:antitoxin component YwqK of YwqJK toxin-antitoxin module